MKKSYNVKPVDEIELSFEDGKKVILKFDVKSLLNLNNLKGGMASFFKEKSLPEMCAKLIYMSGAEYNEGLDLAEARKIVSNLDWKTIMSLMNDFGESMGISVGEGQADMLKKMMPQFLQMMRK
jgi:hypothetical protein